MTELVIRDAATADIPALHRLIESAYRGEASRAGWTTEADLLAGQRTDPEDLATLLEEYVIAYADFEVVLHDGASSP